VTIGIAFHFYRNRAGIGIAFLFLSVGGQEQVPIATPDAKPFGMAFHPLRDCVPRNRDSEPARRDCVPRNRDSVLRQVEKSLLNQQLTSVFSALTCFNRFLISITSLGLWKSQTAIASSDHNSPPEGAGTGLRPLTAPMNRAPQRGKEEPPFLLRKRNGLHNPFGIAFQVNTKTT
jgi:hypothetical protein